MGDLEQAELSVLGSVLLTGGRVLDDLALDGGDFMSPAHETLWDVMVRMHNAGHPVEAGAVLAELSRTPDRVDPLLVHRAIEATTTPESAGYYADAITDAALRRRMGSAGVQIAEMSRGGHSGAEVLEYAEQLVGRAAGKSSLDRVQFMVDSMEDTLELLDAGPQGVIPTPWPKVNDTLGGLTPGAMYVVGARPSVGKSIVGLQLARSMAKKGSVAFVSIEMTRHEVNMRAIAQDTGVSLKRLVRRDLTPRDWELIGYAMGKLTEEPISVLDDTSATMADIRRFARQVNRHKPLAGVVIDYLGLIRQPAGSRTDRFQFVGELSRDCKRLAGELGVPVVVLSQLNRASDSRADQKPRLSDLRESGSIEQDADVVILLNRDISDRDSPLELDIAKHRNGPTGSVSLVFHGGRAMATEGYEDPPGASHPTLDMPPMGGTPGGSGGAGIAPLPYKD